MCVTPTRSRAGRMHRSVTIRTDRSGCRLPSPADAVAETLVERVSLGEPMTAAELLHAAGVLDRFVLSGRQDVLVARVRIAVRLEQLGG
jgi:hypothetical protein